MSEVTWATIDKKGWGEGPWQSEPDKVQWVDEATNLDCLMVRGPHGGWCGYVGVPATHPLHGIGYSQCPQQCGEYGCDHTPEVVLDAHGGITFSDHCHEPTEEQWMADKQDLTLDEWTEQQMARRICHVARPEVGEVWWFGFDCAHCDDYSPAYEGHYRTVFGDSRWSRTYRTQDYVREQVTQLARQLADYPGAVQASEPAPDITMDSALDIV